MIFGSDDQFYTSGAMSPLPTSHHLLEVTLISAQDLHRSGFWMQAYAVAWVDPDHKLRTHVDPTGAVDPNWNDKFVFRVDDEFLHADTSAVTIDIFAVRHLSTDSLVGTVRIVVSSLAPSPSTRFVALQVRRPKSLRPQGIVNVGVALVDSYIPVGHDSDGSSAFMLKDLGSQVGDLSGELEKRSATMDRNRSVSVGNGEIEREAEELESKLERWRIELSPEKEWGSSRSTAMKRRSRSMSCFGCSGMRD